MDNIYIISQNRKVIDAITAETYADAADKFVTMHYTKDAKAIRTTGVTGKSGHFQTLIPFEGGVTSHDGPFLVTEFE